MQVHHRGFDECVAELLLDGKDMRAAVSTGGRTYQLSVPFATPLTIWVYSRTLVLADAQGNTLAPSGAGIPLEVAAGAKPAPITIRVTARR